MDRVVRTGGTLVAVLALGVALCTPAMADQASVQALQEKMEESQQAAAVEANKDTFVRDLLDRWVNDAAARGYDAFFEKGTRKLMRLSTRELLQLEKRASDFDTFYKLAFQGYTVNSFGDLTQDLVYYPINACRIYDSRLATGGLAGPMAPNTQRQISVNDHTTQGGASPDCGTVNPDLDDDPPALALTITAVTPTGPGNLRTFATGDPVPVAAMLTYTAGTTISTGTITSSCTACGPELTVRNQGAGNTDVVVDVTGYFHSPPVQPLSTQVVTESASSIVFDTGWNLSPSCPAGTTLTGGGEDTSFVSFLSTTGNMVHFENGPSGSSWSCRGWNETSATISNVTCTAVCATIPGR